MVAVGPIAQGDGDPGTFVPVGPCAFCGTPCEEDDFCYGCKSLVCEACDHQPSLAEAYREHQRSAHGALERRELMREVNRGRSAILLGRFEEVPGVLNSIEALLRS